MPEDAAVLAHNWAVVPGQQGDNLSKGAATAAFKSSIEDRCHNAQETPPRRLSLS